MSSRKVQNTAEHDGSCLHSQLSGKPRPEGCWEFETSLGYIVSFKVSMGYSMKCCLRPKQSKKTNKPKKAANQAKDIKKKLQAERRF